MAYAILANVNRCVGCWTCSLACGVAFDLPVEEHRMYIQTIGTGGVDLPGGKWPNLYMKWKPVYSQNCIGCHGSNSTMNMPYCVYNCTTEALTFGDMEDPTSAISLKMKNLKEHGCKIYTAPAWENTRSDVFYAEKQD